MSKNVEIYIHDRYRVADLVLNEVYYPKLKICELQWNTWKGIIPEGYEIHHKDFNRLNDHIDNLACIPKDEHEKLHREKK